MVILSEGNSKIFEIDNDLFEEVENYLKNLTKEKSKIFSYIDESGDKIIVIGDEEYVVLTSDDVKAILSAKKDDFLDEDELKRLLDV
jgi:DNA replication initiation complex subunit (GINS family)